MARLFITPREIDFINDINKELIKDVVGQKIFYYSIKKSVTNIHEVYEEAVDKVFNPPIEIEGRVQYGAASTISTRYGVDEIANIEVFLQYRDLIDKDIVVKTGEFFSFDNRFYEILSVSFDNIVYGQIEHMMTIKLTGKKTRIGQINKTPLGPNSEEFTDAGSVQTVFVQQRGFSENRLGPTEDKRALQANGTLDAPISGPAEVSEKGDERGVSSSFYDET